MLSARLTNICDDTTMCIILLLHPTAGGKTCCFADQYSDNKNCQSCMDGADCSFVGSTLASIQLEPGYWRASGNTTDVRECWLAEACVGTNNLSTLTNVTAATRRTTDTAAIDHANSSDFGDIYCAAGYKGPCKYIHILKYIYLLNVYLY
jgi:hypothetical protein